ncbi:MAG: carboxy terminal-processing peptidase [Bernardetiaceae bacterium]
MPLKTLKFGIIGLIIVLFSTQAAHLNTNEPEDLKNSILFRSIYQLVQGYHYEPKAIDDELSAAAYQTYLNNLDYNKRFFLQSDIAALSTYTYLIDDQFAEGRDEFLQQSLQRFQASLTAVAELSEKLLNKPFDFDKKEFFAFDPDQLDYPANEKERQERWRKYFKYQTLTRLSAKLDRQEDGTADDKKSFKALEAEARQEVKKSHEEFLQRMQKLKETDWLSMYVNAFTTQYDPHTNYMPPRTKENFDIGMSGRLEGIGATLYEKEGYITVASIVAGSPCWKQGDLEVGDRITKVAQGDGKPVSILEARVDDAVKLIRGKKGTEVRLTVLKADNTEKIIPIIRDVVIIEATYAKSALLGPQKNIGYIKLPKFYADFTQSGGRNSSSDMRQETEKLKAAGIEGLIIDLRDNSGGSLNDVVDIVGLYIDKGPVVQVKSRNAQPEAVHDKTSGVVYDGPLVVLVNAYSASASEILAAALQDYGRAVIVGTDSATFGKGTVQRFYDLDQMVHPSYDAVKPLGAVKMTFQKFYRVNGGTTQRQGVQPDIVLPNALSLVRSSERDEATALSWDEIKPAKYTPIKPALPIAQLRRESLSRLAQQPEMDKIKAHAQWLKTRREQTQYALHLDTYQAEKKAAEQTSKTFAVFEEPIPEMQIHALPVDASDMATDSTKSSLWEQWQKTVAKDFYLYETTRILSDLQAQRPSIVDRKKP